MQETESVNFVNIIIAAMFLMLVFAIGLVLFVLIYQRKLIKQKLQLQELELSQERALLHNSIRIQEEERKAIAENLHDNIGTQVSLATMTLSSLELYADKESRSCDIVSQTLTILNETAKSIRRINHRLIPPSLANFGLNVAIREFLNRIKLDSVQVFFEETGDDLLSNETRLQLFRIVQEAINNALKHAQSSEINLLLDYKDSYARLIIDDNGIGGISMTGNTGHGILNMQSRAQMINYEITINSGSNGTIIHVSPINVTLWNAFS